MEGNARSCSDHKEKEIATIELCYHFWMKVKSRGCFALSDQWGGGNQRIVEEGKKLNNRTEEDQETNVSRGPLILSDLKAVQNHCKSTVPSVILIMVTIWYFSLFLHGTVWSKATVTVFETHCNIFHESFSLWQPSAEAAPYSPLLDRSVLKNNRRLNSRSCRFLLTETNNVIIILLVWQRPF